MRWALYRTWLAPTLEQKAAMIKRRLDGVYAGYMWNVFVFPDSQNDPGDNLSYPGLDHGVAQLRISQHGGAVARRSDVRQGTPFYIAAALYQFRHVLWAEGDLSVLQDYKQRCILWLHMCAGDVRDEGMPLDLSRVAACILQRGGGQFQARRTRSLRAVLVLRSAPYAMLADGGIMIPGYRVPLRGDDSAVEDRIEAIILPPLPPWQ